MQFFNGFYRGLMPPMIQLIFMNAMSFGLFSQCKIAVQKVLPSSVYDTSAVSHSVLSLIDVRYFMAGALTGAMGGVVSTPFEFVKVQMQLDNVMYKRFRGNQNHFHKMRNAQLKLLHFMNH